MTMLTWDEWEHETRFMNVGDKATFLAGLKRAGGGVQIHDTHNGPGKVTRMSGMEFDTSSHTVEVRDLIVSIITGRIDVGGDDLSTDQVDDIADAIVDELGLVMRRDNLSGNGCRVIGKFIED